MVTHQPWRAAGTASFYAKVQVVETVPAKTSRTGRKIWSIRCHGKSRSLMSGSDIRAPSRRPHLRVSEPRGY